MRRRMWKGGLGVMAGGTAAAPAAGGKGEHDAIFEELMQECRHSAPGARFSARLRASLERMYPAERRALCGRTRDGCAPLFAACKRGNVEMVEYLIHVCDAQLEQRGVYEARDERAAHTVTPLWCAAVAGHLGAVRALADAGAELDAGSDSGSTPVRSACFMTHVAVVRYLVGRGADIHRANHNGGTCLINSVQSAELCAFLVRRGARVDARDAQLKTALHYAIQEHRLETARLLLRHGASPHLASRAGDDALRTACLKGAPDIVALLCAHVAYPPERRADAYELLGATLLDECNDAAAALQAWRRATALRRAGPEYLPKLPERPAAAALGGAVEWRTPADLDALATDVDALRTQALLVAQRVLGPDHKDTVFRLMYRGASYADAFRYRRCIDLWTWALQIRIEKDSLLYVDTCHTACALTRLMLDARGGRLERGRDLPTHDHVARLYDLVADALPQCRDSLSVRPVYKKHAETFDRALRCVTHLVYLLQDTARTQEEHDEVRRRVRRLVASDLRSSHTGDTLLHLCVSQLNVIRSTYFADETSGPAIFPNGAVVSLLVECGADAGATNLARSTPLHVAAVPYNFCSELAERLLAAGAHLDRPNRFGDTPAALMALCRGSGVRPLRHLTLRCLSAAALVAARVVPPAGSLPATLRDFLDMHRA